MKSMFVGTVLISMQLLAATAFAGNEGPAGMPMPRPAKAILTFHNGGAVVPNPVTTDLVVLDSGVVSAALSSGLSVTVATLSLETIASLAAKIEKLGVLDVVDPQPRAPMCPGSFGATYTATNAAGEAVLLGRDYGCHRSRSYNSDANNMIKLLKGFSSLSYQLLGKLQSNPDADHVEIPASALPLLEYVVGVAFSPEPMKDEFQILRDGTIQDHRVYQRRMDPNAPREVLKQYGTLSPFAVDHLMGRVDALPLAALIDLQQGQPVCMDAPFLGYNGYHSNGLKQSIGEMRACHSLRMPGHESDVLIDLLDAMYALTY